MTRRGLLGTILSVTIFVICSLFYSWFAGIAFAAIFLATGFIKIRFPNEHLNITANIVWGLFFAAAICYFPPFVMDGRTFSIEISLENFILNILCVAIVITALYSITANWKLSVILATFILFALSTVNYFVYLFRGKELNVLDFQSLGTALSVADQYQITISAQMMYAWLVWLLIAFAGFSFPNIKTSNMIRTRLFALFTTICLTVLLCVDSADKSVYTWNNGGTNYIGYYLNFYLGMRDATVKEPDSYSSEELNQYAESFSTYQENGQTEYPNIIVIMNESFVDFRVLNQVNTNQPVTPFMDSLSENCIHGYALSSIYGGGTPNSEFEFLTSHSMAFLPEGSTPYQQYINDEIYTLGWLLRSHGYTSFATHPYIKTGWSRNTVYPYLGFEDFTFQEDYPNESLVRSYISDQEMFEYVVDKLHASGSEPLFCFGITMQNHGGYTYEGDNYTKTISLEGYSREYPDVEQYLSLARETDKALAYLLTELQSYPEKTVVLFYGDHFPKLDPQWYEELNGGPLDSLSEQMLKYTVPFFIWTNYDIPEQTIKLTSLNYLAHFVLDAAGIELPAYYRVLKQIEEAIPAINSFGFYSKEQNMFVPFSDATDEERHLLNLYHSLQYNNLFDEQNRNKHFFANYISVPTPE